MPVSTHVAPRCRHNSNVSSSRLDPPGCTRHVTPASSSNSGPSLKGKNASDAATAPEQLARASAAFAAARRAALTRSTCPPPTPASRPSQAMATALLGRCLAAVQAQRALAIASSSSPSPTAMVQCCSLAIRSSASCSSSPPEYCELSGCCVGDA